MSVLGMLAWFAAAVSLGLGARRPARAVARRDRVLAGAAQRPGTFLLALIHPLADLAVLGALLPMVTTAWRRVMLPYLALLVVLVGDALAVGQRALGGHPGVAAQLLALVAALLLGAAPWRVAEASWTRRAPSSAAPPLIPPLTPPPPTTLPIP